MTNSADVETELQRCERELHGLQGGDSGLTVLRNLLHRCERGLSSAPPPVEANVAQPQELDAIQAAVDRVCDANPPKSAEEYVLEIEALRAMLREYKSRELDANTGGSAHVAHLEKVNAKFDAFYERTKQTHQAGSPGAQMPVGFLRFYFELKELIQMFKDNGAAYLPEYEAMIQSLDSRKEGVCKTKVSRDEIDRWNNDANRLSSAINKLYVNSQGGFITRKNIGHSQIEALKRMKIQCDVIRKYVVQTLDSVCNEAAYMKSLLSSIQGAIDHYG
jgi:hypothetical protein